MLNPYVVSLSHHECNQKPGQLNTNQDCVSLKSLTAAALILPGLFQATAQAAEEDSVDFQYSHYQEGRRDTNLTVDANNAVTGEAVKLPVPNNRNPIEVDSLHGSARISLTDRVKFAFNYNEDTWSGATPLGSAPAHSQANNFTRGGVTIDDNGNPTVVGASPYVTVFTYLDSQGKPLNQVFDQETGQTSYVKDNPVHVLSYASPETRKQGDFKLAYEWDEAALDVGGGISTERDYESRFVNVGGRMDFNQKQTTVNLGLSYTNSDIAAVLDPEGSLWFRSDNYKDQIEDNKKTGLKTLHGNRQDWATQLNLTQVVNQDAVVNLGMGYTRSTGFMENPYKISWIFGVTNNQQQSQDGIMLVQGGAFIEQRPDVRNQWHWNARWAQYVEPLDAALHLDYQFAHDDWGINAHTFAADWVQPLGAGWTVTPRIRYYSQEAADFYAPFFIRKPFVDGSNGGVTEEDLLANNPKYFSGDQRLSAYGTLSGGLRVSKQFSKGIGIEAGLEYYTHQGKLKLGGGGEGSFADFDYWVANAALKVQLDALGGKIDGNGETHNHHEDHANVPAGILFGHSLTKEGDIMAGYRYMHNRQAGSFLQGDHDVSEQQIIDQGCPGRGDFNFDGIKDGCSLLPREMTMSMHMLELMYAPTDWLTLMLMPQFVDMQMPLYKPDSLSSEHAGHGHAAHLHETGGIGDTGMFAMVNLFDKPNHHIHATIGVSAPTGDVGIKIKEAGTKNLDGSYIHYGMQLGSGTWDFKPSLTYTGKVDAWSWGAQVAGTKRLEDHNASGYALGDMFEGSLWGGYDLTNWLSTTVRVAYSWQGSIKGHYPKGRRDKEILTANCPRYSFIIADDNNFDGIPDGPAYFHQANYNACIAQPFIKDILDAADAEDRPTPMDAPKNYGGHYVDVGLGLSATVPSGSLAGNKLSFEWLQPLYTNVNGYQLDRDGALSLTWSYGF